MDALNVVERDLRARAAGVDSAGGEILRQGFARPTLFDGTQPAAQEVRPATDRWTVPPSVIHRPSQAGPAVASAADLSNEDFGYLPVAVNPKDNLPGIPSLGLRVFNQVRRCHVGVVIVRRIPEEPQDFQPVHSDIVMLVPEERAGHGGARGFVLFRGPKRRDVEGPLPPAPTDFTDAQVVRLQRVPCSRQKEQQRRRSDSGGREQKRQDENAENSDPHNSCHDCLHEFMDAMFSLSSTKEVRCLPGR